jgi:hypothetical protein
MEYVSQEAMREMGNFALFMMAAIACVVGVPLCSSWGTLSGALQNLGILRARSGKEPAAAEPATCEADAK